VSAEVGVGLPSIDLQLNPWTIFTVYNELESPETAAFFSMWRDYNPLGHYIGQMYEGVKITNIKAQRKKVFQKMQGNITFEME